MWLRTCRRLTGGQWRVRAACGAVLMAGVTACASAPVVIPVPTFPAAAPTQTTTRSPASGTGRRLPTDCEDLMGGDELTALFGLPIASVAAGTVLGAPSPSVGRVERVSCTYTASGPVAPQLQGVILRMVVGAYSDAAAAHDQHERNVDDERAGASSSAQPELGSAAATLIQHGNADSVLLASLDDITLDLDLARRPGPLTPADLLTDLARRVLARLAPNQSSDAASGDRGGPRQP
jgi:hypothetical protein